ncbi:MAG: carbamoyltransferase HypF [Helicobacteraceae bacterium]|jgi:hydrogenase maturation protein HypF|nr:carbamoyltransferase HypF [Helicobacteraceae bacterium]
MERKRFEIVGVVQGVGFRPFVYRLANELKLSGKVYNDGFGVAIEAQGDSGAIAEFQARLTSQKPAAAVISRIDSFAIEARNEANALFTIDPSAKSDVIKAHIPPDTAICAECEKELFDPSDRRFLHPFISCSHCGARYTIISSLPYDRPLTSMRSFVMCEKCRSEYENPLDRRFHAQPIACNECGSVLTLLNAAGKAIAQNREAIEKTAEAIENGAIVAIKALGGYQLCLDAKNDEAIGRLRERKKRALKPLAVLFPSIEEVERRAIVTDTDRELLSSKRRPIVLMKKGEGYDLSPLVAPKIDRIGAMLPSSPIQYLFLKRLNRALISTSANISESPIIIDEKTLFTSLGGVFDFALTHNREIINACDDSVAQTIENQTVMIRRARGFAPEVCVLSRKLPASALALGAEQKSAIAIGFDKNAVVSPHIGDLFNIEAQEYFERAVATLKRLYRFEPQKIICDRHPRYFTTEFAKAQNLPIVQVWHHHAHALAVMAEYGISSDVLAIAWDGSGYGADGTIWGGEFLIASYFDFTRIAHIKPFALIGGEAAIKEPKRIAASLLYEAKIDGAMIDRNYEIMLKKRLNSPLTSSIGRLFDGVAYLAGVQTEYGFDGQSGLMIETLYDENETRSYPFEIENGAIDCSPMIKAIAAGANAQEIASRFLNTLCEAAVIIANSIDLPIVLCGGVFQNKTLANMLLKKLRANGKKVYLPEKFPPNDGAIALGQLAYAKE